MNKLFIIFVLFIISCKMSKTNETAINKNISHIDSSKTINDVVISIFENNFDNSDEDIVYERYDYEKYKNKKIISNSLLNTKEK